MHPVHRYVPKPSVARYTALGWIAHGSLNGHPRLSSRVHCSWPHDSAPLEPIMKLQDLRVKIYADGADIVAIKKLADNPLISGFTTNPSLMRKAGVTDYAAFGKEVTRLVAPRPVSFEVFGDDDDSMRREAQIISRWGDNVYVKIPITNTQSKSNASLVYRLLADGIKVNVTAVMTEDQVIEIAPALNVETPSVLSIFAGRIADAGHDVRSIFARARTAVPESTEVLWASTREVANILHAEECCADIITITPDILAKLATWGKDLAEYSLETVKQFHADAIGAGYAI